MTVVLLLILVVPLYLGIDRIVENANRIEEWSKSLATLAVSQPPAWVEALPVVGARVAARWQQLAVTGCTLFSWGPQSLHRDQVILFDWHDVPAAFGENGTPGSWTLVPEPTSALLTAAGLALLGRPVRRGRRARETP